jgi:hypothetical protein
LPEAPVDPGEARLNFPIEFGHVGKHGSRPDPQALFAIQRLVEGHWLKVFAVAHSAQHAVLAALVMAVQAFGRFNQRRQFFGHGFPDV